MMFTISGDIKECWVNVYAQKEGYHYGQYFTDRLNAVKVGSNFNSLVYRIHVRLK